MKYKYIVYETTNLQNNKIYVGVHKTINPYIFDGYLGCGVYMTQPYTYEHAKTAFQYAVKKYGPKNFVRKTLAIFNTEEEASNLERDIVNEQFLQRKDVYNMILGGLNNISESEKIRVYQYDIEGKFIQAFDSQADAAIALKCDYTLISYAIRKKCKAKGFYWNTDKLEQLDLSNYNKGLNHSIEVHCYLKNGEYFKSYKTQAQAKRELDVSISNIRESRLLGVCVNDRYYFSDVKENSYDKARKQYIENRPVYQYDAEGHFIKMFEHQIDAEHTGINITKAIRLKTADENGNYWGLEKVDLYNKPINSKRIVGKYDLTGALIRTYDSATLAANENGSSVWKVLSGQNKTHKGYIYRYLS